MNTPTVHTSVHSQVVLALFFDNPYPPFVEFPHIVFRRSPTILARIQPLLEGRMGIWGVHPPYLRDGRDAIAFLDDDPPFSNWTFAINQAVVGDYLFTRSDAFYSTYGIFVDCTKTPTQYREAIPPKSQSIAAFELSRDGDITKSIEDGPLVIDYDDVWSIFPDLLKTSKWVIVPDSQGHHFVLVCAPDKIHLVKEVRQLSVHDECMGWVSLFDNTLVLEGFLSKFDINTIDPRVRKGIEDTIRKGKE